MKELKRISKILLSFLLITKLLPGTIALTVQGDDAISPLAIQTGIPEVDAILDKWGDFWDGIIEDNEDGTVTLSFRTDQSQLIPQVVRNNPEYFNLYREQTGVRTEISSEFITHGSLAEDTFYNPFGAPTGVPYTRTVYSYEFAGNNPLPASLIGQLYQDIYATNGYITRLINGTSYRFSLVSAGNHRYLDDLVDPSNNGTASWHSVPGDGVYTLSGWVGRTGANGTGGAHFRLEAGQYVNLQMLQDVSIGGEIVVHTTVARYNQWVFNSAHQVTQPTEDGLVWMRLTRVAPASGASGQNNPRFNWQKFVISTEPVFNAVTFSWSELEVVNEFPIYTYFWNKSVIVNDAPTDDDPTDDDPTDDDPTDDDPTDDDPTDDDPTDDDPTDDDPTDDDPTDDDPTDDDPTDDDPTDDDPTDDDPTDDDPTDDDLTDNEVEGMMPEIDPIVPEQPQLPQAGATTLSPTILGGAALTTAGIIAKLKKDVN